MPMFKLPLSGDITQSINPWTAIFNPTGGQYGLVNITLGQSSAPEVEADVLSDVAGYGKQLGRIGDAVLVLINHLPENTALSQEDIVAIYDLKEMLADITKVKKRHNRSAAQP
ncbi:MAG: hypothetical protein CR217_03380 [Beijerinckiaceae bacterium]|nr:MAG: hypothetical protein CR217_03380 [Beijerinckiaceae bacterium]